VWSYFLVEKQSLDNNNSSTVGHGWMDDDDD
jgi:hypothetical protein